MHTNSRTYYDYDVKSKFQIGFGNIRKVARVMLDCCAKEIS